MRTLTKHIGKWIGLREMTLLVALLVGTFFAGLVFASVPLGAVPLPGEVRAADNLVGTPGGAAGVPTDGARVQTFTSDVNGVPSSAELHASPYPPTAPTTVEIRKVDTDYGTAARLGATIASGEVTIDGSWLGEVYRVYFNSQSTTELAAGQKYALVLHDPSGSGTVDWSYLEPAGTSTYAGGWAGRIEQDPNVVYSSGHPDDFVFAVYVKQAVQDLTAPEIFITTPAEGVTYLLNQSVAAHYWASDSESGLASVNGDKPNGDPIDTASVGPKVFHVTATDVAGNLAEEEAHYSVVYDFQGFFAPVDNPGPDNNVYNTVKAGSAIPVKFSLAGDQTLEIFAAGYPVSHQIPKVAGVDTDAIEQTVTAGKSGLSYDQLTGQYTYVWKTDKAWAKTDRELILKLADGTEHTALFRFTK